MSADHPDHSPTDELSQTPEINHNVTTSPPPPPQPADPLARTYVGSVCHVEDVNDPCTNPDCDVHTAANTPALSRNASVANLEDSSIGQSEQRTSQRGFYGNHDAEASGALATPPQNSQQPEELAIEEPTESHSSAVSSLPPPAENVAPYQEPEPEHQESAAAAEGNVDGGADSFGSAEVVEQDSSISAPVDNSQASTNGHGSTSVSPPPPVSPPTESVSTNDALDTPAQSTPSPEAPQKAALNWDFDDPSALREHVREEEDAFAQLHSQAPDRTASFPAVQDPVQDASEQDILAMMAREAATTENEQNPFDGSEPLGEPASDLFGPEETGGDDFFNQLGSGDENATPEAPMGGEYQGNGNENMTQQDDERREEGVPLMSTKRQSELVVNTKDELDFFSDGDTETDSNFFGSPGVQNHHQRFGSLERKDTEQVIGNALHSYHSGAGVAASMSTVASQALEEVEAEKGQEPVNDLFSPVKSEDGDGDDYFGQLNQQPAETPAPVQESAPPQEDDLAAKWKAALASDEFLEEDSLLGSDSEDSFLPSDDEEDHSGLVAVSGPGGQLQGFTSASAQQAQPLAANNNRYAPPQIPQPPQQQWPGQQQPVHTGTPSAYQPLAPPQLLRNSQSAYFNSPTSPYAQQPPAPPAKKLESFLDKKEGYHSPYDLPMDLDLPVPRRKPAVQYHHGQPPLGSAPPAPPARTSSFGALGAPSPGLAPPTSVPPPKQDFFAELPSAPPKPRATSAMGRYAPNQQPGAPPMARGNSMGFAPPPPAPQGPYNPPPQQQPQYAQQPMFTQSPHQSPAPANAQIAQYPGQPQQQQQQMLPQPGVYPQTLPLPATPAINRYSPAISRNAYAPPPVAQAGSRPVSSHGAIGAHGSVAQPAQQPPASGKYAPRSSGPPQITRVPSGQYAPPPSQAPPQAPSQPQYVPPPAPQPQQQQPQYQQPQPAVENQHMQQQAVQRPPIRQQSMPPLQQQPMMSPPMQGQQPLHQQFGSPGERRGSGDFVLHSSRPGTATGAAPTMEPPREEEELEQEQPQNNIGQNNGYPPPAPAQHNPLMSPPLPISSSKYAPVNRGTSTPPPPSGFMSPPPMTIPHNPNLLSPQKGQLARSVSPNPPMAFVPPPRAATSSPGLLYGRPKHGIPLRDPYERPVSALAQSAMPHNYPEQRRESMQINFLRPDDISGTDPLNRWQGAPVFSWGFGGTITSMFPVRTQRFTSDLQAPLTKCSPGGVKVRNLTEVLPIPEESLKFPGPVWTGSKSKAKKKEAIAYMDSRIEAFEKSVPENYDPVSRRDTEQLAMLWKIVRQMIENDGALEGTPEIQATMRNILTPEIAQIAENEKSEAGFVSMAGITSMQAANAETVDRNAVQEFKLKLILGEHEAAVWHAVDKRLWAHALLISNTVSKDLWKQVVQQFVKAEVKTLGEGSESLAVLYETLAGNHEESVDELVPVSTRMGMRMLSSEPNRDQPLEERLGKWRETLALILSNRSPGDQASILALGRLLNGYGWVGAAHICYIFARQAIPGSVGAIYGGAQEPTTTFALLGADHTKEGEFTCDMDTIMLSELYEFAISLSSHVSPVTPISPHLQVWKLYHAIVLAETGRKTEAQKYCDAIAAAVKAWNRPNPYFHKAFFDGLEDLTKRLQEAPRDASSASGPTFLGKLTSDAVSTSMWSTFNNFVSGGEAKDGEQKDGEGPFGRITPDVSRNQSTVDLYSMYQQSTAPYGTPVGSSPTASRAPGPAMNAAASRYAPGASARNSQEGARPNPYDLRRTSTETSRGTLGGYDGYQGGSHQGGYNSQPGHQQDQQSNSNYTSPRSAGFNNSYQPRQSLDSTPEVAERPTPSHYSSYEPSTAGATGGGYEPPSNSGGYAPPSDEFVPYQPEPENEEEESDKPKPKKKSMLDDDDDDGFTKRSEAVKKADAERKRKEEEEAKKKGKQQDTSEGGKKGWFGGWFGGKSNPDGQQGGPIKAKLGEESSFVYDPDLKRWVNKKAGETAAPAPKAAPPPKRTPTPSASGGPAPPPPAVTATPPGGTPQPPRGMTPNPPQAAASAPPQAPGLAPPPAAPSRGPSPGPPMGGMGARSVSASPARPPPSGDAMDDLLGPPTSRRGTPAGRKKKGGASRYVEVIPGQQ